jgi:uncharacterized protein YbbC (DUF1343 family)
MQYAMKACAAAGISFFVLDRPNPIGGDLIEGPSIEPGYESFIGAYPVPIRHGLTVGELAQLLRAELALDLDLTVIPCAGLTRSMFWSDTGLPWVLPSPNMPTPDTAVVYPGGCLVEGTNLSEGRGTTRPFELWGAPWIGPFALAERLESALLATGRSQGLAVRPCSFEPTFQKHADQTCGGVQIHVTDSATFEPVAVYTLALAVARELNTELFAWRTEPYEFVSNPIAIDLLFGSARERTLIESDRPERWAQSLFEGEWKESEDSFRARRRPYLLYE